MWETPPEGSGANLSFYAHTHASFTHLKYRPKQNRGPIVALSYENQIDGSSLSFLATVAGSVLLVLLEPEAGRGNMHSACEKH